MSKRILTVLFCLLAIILPNCEGSINGKEVWDASQDEKQANLCDMGFLFYSDYDPNLQETYWSEVDVTNKPDQNAHIQIVLKNSGDIALDDYIGARQKDVPYTIYIDDHTKIIIKIWHWQKDSGDWAQCPEKDTEFTL